jgi:type III pantothenate kinase
MKDTYPLLILDIGNTDTTFAWHDGHGWAAHWRIPSVDDGLLAEKLDQILIHKKLQIHQLKNILISSVVPHITPIWQEILEELTQKEILLVGPSLYKKLPIGIPSPEEIGSDLVANALAAYSRFRQACIVVDFGTALTFTAIDEHGNIQGVAIAPGLHTAMYALFHKAAQLPEVPLEVPASALGKNTTHALQAGILLGYEGLVKELLHKIKAEMSGDVKVIATGGLSTVIQSLKPEFDEMDKMLTLEGLRLMAIMD